MSLPVYLSIDGHRYWVDRLNPWLVHFGDHFGIRWYGLAYLAGFVLPAWIFSRWSREGRLPIPQEEVLPFILYVALGVMIGGRLGYCILYNAHDCFHHPLVIFEVWQGGMASHGGIAGMVIAVCIYARRQHVRALPLVDAAAATGPLGIMLGRCANFVNGELWAVPLMFRGLSFSLMRRWWTATRCRAIPVSFMLPESKAFSSFSSASGCTAARHGQA